MRNRPEDCSDDTINKLVEAEMKGVEHLAAAMDRVQELMRRSPDARRYDLRYEYNSMLPVEERWSCWDENSFGIDEACGSFKGYGGSEKRARKDLLEQFADFDEKPKPRASRVIFSSPFEPAEHREEFRDYPDED